MLKIFNQCGLTRRQRKAIKNISSCAEDVKTWTNFYVVENNLKRMCK